MEYVWVVYCDDSINPRAEVYATKQLAERALPDGQWFEWEGDDYGMFGDDDGVTYYVRRAPVHTTPVLI